MVSRLFAAAYYFYFSFINFFDKAYLSFAVKSPCLG